MPNAEIHAVYGSTEAEPIAHVEYSSISQDDWTAMASGGGLLAGCPIDDISLKLVDSEILVSGPHVNQGYLDSGDNTSTKVFEQDRIWHRTGDSGTLDQQNRLWLLGRHQATTNGLHPFVLETAALSWPGVERAALCQSDNGKSCIAVSGSNIDL